MIDGRRRARRQQVLAWIVFVALILFVAYVWTRNFADVGPLSWDHPQINPRPQRAVELHVSVPPTLKVQLYSEFSTWGKDCNYYTNFPLDKTPFSHTDVIELQGEGDKKTAMVTLDRYLPGRCNWYNLGIRYELEGRKASLEDRVANMGVVAVPLERLTRGGARPQKPGEKLREGRVDLWCGRHLFGLPASATSWCTNWSAATGARAPPHDPVPNAPDSDKEDDPITFILPSTRVVEIYFHDLDAGSATSKPAR